jgi:CheY-like chemotaxis protein
MTLAGNTQQILLVDDSDDDFETVCEALRLSGLQSVLRRATDGDACMALLRRGGAERPVFVMMDLNTSRTDGRDALRQIKTDPKLRMIPVVVVTTSANPRDVDLCYEYGANAYHVKPVRYPDHLRMLRQMLDYWLAGVLKPTLSKPSP